MLTLNDRLSSVNQRILLVRHGETDWNQEGRLQGQIDIPLNHQGKRQAQALRGYLRSLSFSQAFSSPLRRARETAELILGDRGIPLKLMAGLREISHGSWEGQLESEIRQQSPHQYQLWKTQPAACSKPGGETLKEFEARVIPTWEYLVERCGLVAGQTTLVVAHKFTIQVILSYLAGLKAVDFTAFPQDNCAVNIVDYHQGVPHLVIINLNLWEAELLAA